MSFSTRGRLFHFTADQLRITEMESEVLLLDIFEACKSGDFSSTRAFPNVFQPENPPSVTIGALELLPYVTPYGILLDIAEPICSRLRPDGQDVEWLCIALSRSGSLAATEKSVTIYQDELTPASSTDLPYHLSITLEASAGDIFYGPPSEPEPVDEFEPERLRYDMTGYSATVKARIAELRAAFPGWPRQCFLYGQPVNIEELALGMLNTIAGAFDNERVVVGRSVLEAFTGHDLSAFFRNGLLDRTSAAAALEALFDAVDLSAFQPGLRYFFGRRVPD